MSLLAGQLDQRLNEHLQWLQQVGNEISIGLLQDSGALQVHLDNRPILRKLFNEVVVVLNGDENHSAVQYLNVSFNYVEGESLLMGIKGVAVSSGSACTSASLEPSYVLRALGRSDELAHSSLRMTIGRWTTEEEIDYAIDTIRQNVGKLRDLSPLWEMYQDGFDISTIQWTAPVSYTHLTLPTSDLV